MTHNKSKLERRGGMQVPSFPGNYPGNFIKRLHILLRSDPDHLQTIHEQKQVRRIILAADIRNFSKSLEQHGDERVLQFMSMFLSYASERIQRLSCSFVNKYTGGGFFAQTDIGCDENSATIEDVIEVSLDLMRVFIGLKMHYGFTFANLSIAITEANCIESTVGNFNYIDFSIIGKELNNLFKLLSQTEGSIITLSNEIISKTHNNYHSVYVGMKQLSGIAAPIPIYSLIRKKSQDEAIENGKVRICSKDTCPESYDFCKKAWDSGVDSKSRDEEQELEKEYFDLNCNHCGDTSKCGHWMKCLSKLTRARSNKPCICCHICANFRNCYNCYQLGRRGEKMISCDADINQAFYVLEG
ncbi:MAG: hypothetical protein ACD_4C00134G0002 [uncultured bacterium (gcode 4)]|uniref:Guanylate cyclase domain-containing protein n=1 Tax=uncultured bacterium (gcode 4) TaxID=1234023 RepID=K2F6X3_9BACT|nr:MAG: hypothetical protein ACD_4C00134G0002 [uncultured bacterium (gcode 4)]